MPDRRLSCCALCAAFLLFLAPQPVFATDSVLKKCYSDGVRVVAKRIPLMVENSTEGIFIRLTEEVFRHLKLPWSIVAEPAKRATRDFEGGHYDILLPVVRQPLAPENNLFSTPIFVRRDFAFVREGETMPASIADLEGKRVLLTSQYRYPPAIMDNSKIRKVMGNDDVANMKALARGRGDAFVVEEFSGLRAASAAGFAEFRYDSDAPLSTVEINMALHRDACAARLLGHLNQAISKVLASRFYRRTMGQDANW